MSFSPVTWSFKDLLSSSKLAQMVENLRVHDHRAADQGARIGILADSGESAALSITTAAQQITSFTFPASAGREADFSGSYLLITPGAAGQTFVVTIAGVLSKTFRCGNFGGTTVDFLVAIPFPVGIVGAAVATTISIAGSAAGGTVKARLVARN